MWPDGRHRRDPANRVLGSPAMESPPRSFRDGNARHGAERPCGRNCVRAMAISGFPHCRSPASYRRPGRELAGRCGDDHPGLVPASSGFRIQKSSADAPSKLKAIGGRRSSSAVNRSDRDPALRGASDRGLRIGGGERFDLAVLFPTHPEPDPEGLPRGVHVVGRRFLALEERAARLIGASPPGKRSGMREPNPASEIRQLVANPSSAGPRTGGTTRAQSGLSSTVSPRWLKATHPVSAGPAFEQRVQ